MIETFDKLYENKIAIECGKLITHEIINNTIDKTGLLEKEYD